MSKSSRLGATFEQQVADYAAKRLGDKRIERRAKNGKNDRGDISGLMHLGKRVVAECKCCKRLELSGWLKEAETERGNDDAEYGIVIHKRFGGNFVTMTLDTYLAMCAGGFDLLEER